MTTSTLTDVPADLTDRLVEVLSRTVPKLAPEAREQLASIINPTSIAVIASVLVAWVGSHAIGIGELIDIVVAVIGFVSMGVAVFAGLDHLWEFAAGSYSARTSRDLDKAADHYPRQSIFWVFKRFLRCFFAVDRRPMPEPVSRPADRPYRLANGDIDPRPPAR